MRKSKAQERLYMANVRKLMVYRPDIPIIEAQRQLEENGIRLDYDYVSKLYNKIINERAYRMERRIMSYALSFFEDAMFEIEVQLWIVYQAARTKQGEKIYALAELRKTYETAFDKLFDAGVFKKHLGQLDLRLRDALLPPDVREDVVKTAMTWFKDHKKKLHASDNDSPAKKAEPDPAHQAADPARETAETSGVA